MATKTTDQPIWEKELAKGTTLAEKVAHAFRYHNPVEARSYQTQMLSSFQSAYEQMPDSTNKINVFYANLLSGSELIRNDRSTEHLTIDHFNGKERKHIPYQGNSDEFYFLQASVEADLEDLSNEAAKLREGLVDPLDSIDILGHMQDLIFGHDENGEHYTGLITKLKVMADTVPITKSGIALNMIESYVDRLRLAHLEYFKEKEFLRQH